MSRAVTLFDKLPADGVKKKLTELNTKLASDTATAAAALLPAELSALLSAVDALTNPAAFGPAAASPDALSALRKALGWPAGVRFPALDVLRQAMLHPTASAAAASDPAVRRSLLRRCARS
jgi:hypothetical protein